MSVLRGNSLCPSAPSPWTYDINARKPENNYAYATPTLSHQDAVSYRLPTVSVSARTVFPHAALELGNQAALSFVSSDVSSFDYYD